MDLKREALDFERAYGIERTKAGLFSAWRRFELRAYRLPENSRVAGLCVSAAEAEVPDHRLFVQRIRRGDDIIEAEPGLTLQAGDVVAIAGPRDILVEWLGRGPQEVEDRQLLDVPVAVVQVLLTNRDLVGRSLAELAQGEWTRSLYLREVTRGGEKIPLAPGITLERGDMLQVVGPETVVARAGLPDRAGGRADDVHGFRDPRAGHLPWRAIGVLVTFPIGGMNISLSSSVGTLLMGLLVGHLRTRYPLFGRIPEGAVNLMTALGLAAFVGMTGLHAGPVFFSAAVAGGHRPPLRGHGGDCAPMIVGLYFGRYVLRINPCCCWVRLPVRKL